MRLKKKIKRPKWSLFKNIGTKFIVSENIKIKINQSREYKNKNDINFESIWIENEQKFENYTWIKIVFIRVY